MTEHNLPDQYPNLARLLLWISRYSIGVVELFQEKPKQSSAIESTKVLVSHVQKIKDVAYLLEERLASLAGIDIIGVGTIIHRCKHGFLSERGRDAMHEVAVAGTS